MRFADTGGWTLDANAFSDSADALGEAEIGNGRPDIGMRDGMKGGSLFLNGYNGRTRRYSARRERIQMPKREKSYSTPCLFTAEP